ncbi:unnamed protein product [Adineta steineri]|uniref:Uncharacterized protein n=1 Tax=Adineta steineri TaxID=433720 RepID=A0A815NBS2_9BILA|nr:unnamed protein product [Adineta steineri]CAF1436102.1 unnamed protein product [Adineta steineri]
MAGIYNSVKTFITTLNLFESYPRSTDTFDITNERISTWIFLVLYTLSIAVLGTYTSVIIVEKSEIVESPCLSKYQSLQSKYGNSSVTCFCTTVSVPYQTFLRIEPIFHSLCSSQFVSSEWIDYLINASQFSSPKHDFRQIGPRIFQFLSGFCQLAKDEMTSNSLPKFYSQKFISALVESEDVFKVKAYEMINAFKSAAAKELASTFDIILLTTSTNKLISNIYTSAYSKRRRAKQKLVPIVPMEYSKNCSCHMSYHCSQNMTLKNGSNGDEFQVTGLQIGCYVVQALLQSNLQCFYNSTCINQIQSILNYSTTINITALNHSSSFQSNSTIQHLIEQSMIDQWFENVSYKFYYEKCQPSHCILTYSGRNDLIYIVTYLFGIIGGLAMVLMIIIPPIVKFIRRKQRPVTNVQIHHDTIARDISIGERLGHLKKQLIDALIKFNIIRSYPPAVSQYDITSLVTVTRSVRVLSPSLSLYLKLYEKYPETLSCPCTSLLINYGEFLSLNFELHPVCRSDFVSEKWTNPLINVSSEMNEAYQYLQSFAYWGPLFFRLLSDLCQLSEKTIYHNLALFNSTSFITVYLLPNNTFYRSSEMFIDLFEQNLIQSLNQSMSLIRITSLGNGHVSPIALRGGIVPVENPSFEDYNQLVAEYDSVECSCSSISIPYGQFIEINTEYHQICYSAFVEQRWIEYFSDAMYWAWYLHLNERVPYRSNLAFHTAGGRSLAVFSALCQYINETIWNSRNIFYNSRYISTFIISERLFRLEINATIDQFIQDTLNSFVNTLKLIEISSRANALQTVERTDSYVMFMANHLEGTSVYQTYGNKNCSCEYPTSDCYQEAQFFRYHTRNYSTTYQFSSTGFYTGCYIMESLRHSTLEFFYNQTNVDKLPDAITVAGFPLYPDEVKHLAILNVSLNNPKEIVGQILDRMLVERWNRSVSYQSYFEECNSTECRYTTNKRNAHIYVVTTIFGLSGGILTILRMIIPFLVRLIRNTVQPWLRRIFRRTVQPIDT